MATDILSTSTVGWLAIVALTTTTTKNSGDFKESIPESSSLLKWHLQTSWHLKVPSTYLLVIVFLL